MVERDFRRFHGRYDEAQVFHLLESLHFPLVRSDSERERIQAAILILARGSVDRLVAAVREAEGDWRDVLVSAGLANESWQDCLAAALGPDLDEGVAQ